MSQSGRSFDPTQPPPSSGPGGRLPPGPSIAPRLGPPGPRPDDRRLRRPPRADASRQEHRGRDRNPVPHLLPRFAAGRPLRLRRRARPQQRPGRLPGGLAAGADAGASVVHLLHRRGLHRLRLEPPAQILRGRHRPPPGRAVPARPAAASRVKSAPADSAAARAPRRLPRHRLRLESSPPSRWARRWPG